MGAPSHPEDVTERSRDREKGPVSCREKTNPIRSDAPNRFEPFLIFTNKRTRKTGFLRENPDPARVSVNRERLVPLGRECHFAGQRLDGLGEGGGGFHGRSGDVHDVMANLQTGLVGVRAGLDLRDQNSALGHRGQDIISPGDPGVAADEVDPEPSPGGWPVGGDHLAIDSKF